MPEVSLQIEPEREDSEYCASKVNMILKQYLNLNFKSTGWAIQHWYVFPSAVGTWVLLKLRGADSD